MPDKPHVAFFFGAGVSDPSDLPLGDAMNDRVLHNDLLWQGSASKRFGEPGEVVPERANAREVADQVRRFLRELKTVLGEVLREQTADRGQGEGHGGERPVAPSPDHLTSQVGSFAPNYEDLYHVCERVLLTERGQIHDPQAALLAERVRAELGGLLCESQNDNYTDLGFTALLGMVLVRSVLFYELSDPDKLEGLGAVLGAARGSEASRVTAVTLNHDCLVETLFEQNGLPAADPDGFQDGFGPQLGFGDLRPYEPGRLLSGNARVRVVKPHGSISWYPTRQKSTGITARSSPEGYERFFRGYAAIDGPSCRPSTTADFFEDDTPALERAKPAELRANVPALLSSTGKERDYGRDLFGDMMLAMLQTLHDADVIVVSGFGWKDPGMQQRLLGALRRSPEKRMLLLHRRSEEEIEANQFVGDLDWMTADTLYKGGQLYHEERWLCEFTWEELWEEISDILS